MHNHLDTEKLLIGHRVSNPQQNCATTGTMRANRGVKNRVIIFENGIPKITFIDNPNINKLQLFKFRTHYNTHIDNRERLHVNNQLI